MRKVLVTGGFGFIGTNLIYALEKQGYEVWVLDNMSGALKVQMPFLDRFIHGDIANDSTWMRLVSLGLKFDVIYHLAASFANELSVDFPHIDCSANIVGTVNTVRYAKLLGQPIIVYTGSSSSYGAMGSNKLSEGDEMHPSTPYAISKYVGEMYLKSLYKEWSIARLFNVYGPHDYPGKYRNAIPKMIDKALKGETLTVFGEHASRDFTYVDEVVTALIQLADMPSDTYNICTGEETRILTLAKQIIDSVGSGTIDIQPSRDWDKVPRRVGNPYKLANAPKPFKAVIQLEDGLKETIKFIKGVVG